MISSVKNSCLTFFKETFADPDKRKQIALVAIAALMVLGLALSYFLGAPWLVTLGFFALVLIPVFPLWKVINPSCDRIEETQ